MDFMNRPKIIDLDTIKDPNGKSVTDALLELFAAGGGRSLINGIDFSLFEKGATSRPLIVSISFGTEKYFIRSVSTSKIDGIPSSISFFITSNNSGDTAMVGYVILRTAYSDGIYCGAFIALAIEQHPI